MTEPTDPLAEDWANSGQRSDPTSDPTDRIGPGADLSPEQEAAIRSGQTGRVVPSDIDQPETQPAAPAAGE